MWVRGLKHRLVVIFNLCAPSHPVWVRGLKQNSAILWPFGDIVAPRVGAWIETKVNIDELDSIKSHPVWVRGLKPY